MIYNPSYYELAAVNIGVPDGNYVDHDRTAAVDVGATFFADSRLAVEGLHSLRLCNFNPSNDSAGHRTVHARQLRTAPSSRCRIPAPRLYYYYPGTYLRKK